MRGTQLDRSKRTRGLGIVCHLAVVAACLLAGAAHGQVAASATGPGRALWAGAEYSTFQASFPYGSERSIWGIGAFADYHVTAHFAVGAEARFLRFNNFYGETEENYLGGVRYEIGTFRRFQPYAQCLAGIGKIRYPFQIGNGTYLAVAPAAGVNYRLAQRWTVRGAYEYQFWPNSPDIADEPEHRLTPNGFSIGVAYRIFR